MKILKKTLFGGLVALGSLAQQAAAAHFTGDRSDFRDETIYFVMTARFYDGDITNNTYCWDGKNNVNDPEWRGDFKGLIEKMDYLKALGFTAIWITPVVENASGLDYHGYHAMNFQKVDPRNESEDVKFQDVIDEAHKRDMKIVLDVVLQHTGNFGEEYLCPMFQKANIKNQSNHQRTMQMHPDSKLSEDYWSLIPGHQHDARIELLKNVKGTGGDPNNYWHHVGQAWDWDDPSRWWGQIAGDCVDLNTENPHVYNYIVDCYTKFIDMGVDAFRVDTSGHISRLTFNKVFIPRFHAAAEKAKAKRGGAPFYMFGEVCAVSEEVIYRNQHFNCSPCFYTWKETKDYPWDEKEESWNGLTYSEVNPSAYANTTNGASVLAQATDYLNHDASIMPNSNNAFLNGNEYHTPDYSQASGFNVIDFPMHQRYYRASNAFTVRSEDHLYNDATWNVVYVDSHDYGPNGYKVNAFDGTEDTWAENLSLMFTWRGIPCVFQGTETRFRRTGGYVIDQGINVALKETLRAYYGGYLTGSINTTDFTEYTDATGNLAASLTHPLALHLQRLNKIRAAVPALRKGQYSTEGCSGEMSFKRRYTNGTTDSYVLVTISGSSTFTGILNGKYVDAITGDVKNVTDGTLTADCSGKGNMRIYVLNGPGKIGDDGKYLYAASPASVAQQPYDGQEEAPETVTKRDDGPFTLPSVLFNPGAGAFKTETQTVTASLSEDANTGWYKVGDSDKVTLTSGSSQTFTIGEDMNYGDNIQVTWGATGEDGNENTGTATYRKVDPNAVITVYVKSSIVPNIYAWEVTGSTTTKFCGEWPGKAMTSKTTVNGEEFYYETFADAEESVNIILNGGGGQTADITGITEDTYFEYNGGSQYTKLDIDDPRPQPTKPVVKANPNGGMSFTESITVSLTVNPAGVPIHYTIDGSVPTSSSATYDAPLTFTETTTLKTYVEKDGESNVQTFVYTKTEAPVPGAVSVYYDGDWTDLHIYVYNDGGELAKWDNAPAMTLDPVTGYYMYNLPDAFKNSSIIFKSNGQQYPGQGQSGLEVKGKSMIFHHSANQWVEYTPLTAEDINDLTDALDIRIIDGALHIFAPRMMTVSISDLTGRMQTIPVTAGLNVIDGLEGFYIVNGKKLFVR